MTVTEPVPEISQQHDALLRLLEGIVHRVPWHSEAQKDEHLGLLRDAEGALKGDGHSADTAVVSGPAWFPENPDPTVAELQRQLSAGPSIDYAKLAEMVASALAKKNGNGHGSPEQSPGEGAAPAPPGAAPAS